MYIYIIHTYLSIYICIYYPQKIFTWPWWPDSTSIWGAMDQLDGWLHGPAGWLRSEDPGGWHRHRLHRGLCQGCGGEGERVVCDVMGQKRRNIGEKMGRSGKNMWRNSEKDGSRGIYSHGKMVIEAAKDADFCPTKIGGEKQPLHCYTRRVHHEGFASRWGFHSSNLWIPLQ